MTLSTDQLYDATRLSLVGRTLATERNRILSAWESRLREASTSAAELTRPILIDTMPSFLDNLAEALSPSHPRPNAVAQTTVAEEHGGERARLTNYNLGQLIEEYQLLREVVLEILEEQHPLSVAERRVLHSSFNSAIREAATAFALVHSDVREQFVATLTHDLRNPLTSVAMASELLLHEPGISPEGRMLVSKIVENARRMDRMIQDLLDVTYSRAGGRLNLRIVECSILDIVKEVVSHMTLAHGKKFEIKGGPVRGHWDADAIRRAIENLAVNAIKYGDPHAPVIITTAHAHGRLIIMVRNEGEPIPIEEQAAIFQAYKRSKSNRAGKSGWGIGLALVRAVAEAHGGSMGLDSAVGRGTTFTIDIPQDARPFV